MVLGQQTTISKRHLKRCYLNFQIVFQPAGFFRLTGISPVEVTNRLVDATQIFSPDILLVQEQLQHCKNYREMIVIASAFSTKLIKNVRKDFQHLDTVSKLMMQSGRTMNLDWLAKESCLCSKQFKRKFNERVGVNPKLYARIIRFTQAFNTKNAHPDWDWLRIAINCNYFDYQHLAKDYKEFTSLPPVAFHLLESNSPETMLGLSQGFYQSRI